MFFTYKHLKFHAQLNWAQKKFYNLGAWALAFLRSLNLAVFSAQGTGTKFLNMTSFVQISYTETIRK